MLKNGSDVFACETCGGRLVRLNNGATRGTFCEDCGQRVPGMDEPSEADVRAFASEIHRGRCPRCSRAGPVDLHFSHQVWSALLVTRWKRSRHLACRDCGIKAQWSDMGISALTGWWGFPWGLLVTPMQLCRNAFAMAFPPKPGRPSDNLVEFAREILQARMDASAEEAGA